MGCDYYIAKVLYIYYNNIDYLPIELYRDSCDYYYDFDIEDIDYEKKINEYKNNILISQFQPIILYDNCSFKKKTYENKYKLLIENEITRYHIKWNDIIQIIKIEERYERD